MCVLTYWVHFFHVFEPTLAGDIVDASKTCVALAKLQCSVCKN